MAKGSLSNILVGKKVKPAQTVIDNPDLLQRIWGLRPNLSNEYFGTIMAAFLESDANSVKVLVTGPMGDIKHMYMLDGLIEIEKN